MTAEEREKKEELLRQTLANLVELGYSVTADDLGKLNPPDEYEDELEVMAEVRAYFQVAYKVRVAHVFPPSLSVCLSPLTMLMMGASA